MHTHGPRPGHWLPRHACPTAPAAAPRTVLGAAGLVDAWRDAPRHQHLDQALGCQAQVRDAAEAAERLAQQRPAATRGGALRYNGPPDELRVAHNAVSPARHTKAGAASRDVTAPAGHRCGAQGPSSSRVAAGRRPSDARPHQRRLRAGRAAAARLTSVSNE